MRLLTGSPAVDAGKNDYIAGTLSDLDGNRRISDGNRDGTATVDMGAYESEAYYFLPIVKR